METANAGGTMPSDLERFVASLPKYEMPGLEGVELSEFPDVEVFSQSGTRERVEQGGLRTLETSADVTPKAEEMEHPDVNRMRMEQQ